MRIHPTWTTTWISIWHDRLRDVRADYENPRMCFHQFSPENTPSGMRMSERLALDVCDSSTEDDVKISEFCIRRPVFATMLIATLVVFGLSIAIDTSGVNYERSLTGITGTGEGRRSWWLVAVGLVMMVGGLIVVLSSLA